MDETSQAKGKSTAQNKTNVEELSDLEGSDYCQSEHETSASKFFYSDNNHCDVADEGCKLGFKNHCRPFISIDGCFLKGYYQGHILVVVGIDANDCIYPIAVAVVETETHGSWCWFLQLLAEDLGIVNFHHVIFMFDKQKGLIESLLDLFPYAKKRNCVRHLYSNFKNDESLKGKALKDALWKAARTTIVRDYEKAMAEIRRILEGAHNWLQSKGLITWSKSHFSTHSKCDTLLNNYLECFNKMIIDARDKPILTMVEIIRTKMMQRISKKAEAAQKCWPSHAGALRYKVAFGPSDQHVVDLEAGVCSCRKWDLTGARMFLCIPLLANRFAQIK
ncbi:hypothetical protein V6N13_108650 [Hibiscus sabdariffa]